jgi:hypothetical protein
VIDVRIVPAEIDPCCHRQQLTDRQLLVSLGRRVFELRQMGQHRIFEIEQAICPGDSHCDRRERLRYRVHVAAIVSHPPEGDRSLAVTRDVDAF